MFEKTIRLSEGAIESNIDLAKYISLQPLSMEPMLRLGLLLGSLSLFFFWCAQQIAGLKENYYSTYFWRAKDIVKEQVYNLYEEHDNTVVSWIRLIFHDCIVQVPHL